MNTKELVAAALEVRQPWQVTQIRHDLGPDQIDVWIGKEAARSGWLFGARSSPSPGDERRWRHVNLGRLRCVIHGTPSPDGEAPVWLGDEEQPFTRLLSRRVAGLMHDGIGFGTICDLLDLPVAELWKFKHRLDNGKAVLAAPPASRNEPLPGLPAADDPLWESLLDGSLGIEMHALGLKLLLTKLREQWAVIGDPEVRALKVQELRRYFIRHEKSLARELAQLRLRATSGGERP